MKVSVIIPCYNVDKYIADCVKSVENQTYSNIEVVCVDDGSSDQTVATLEKLASNSPLSIRIIRQENRGAPSARDNGVKHSSGGYFQFLDADDLLLPDKIKGQIELAKENNFPDLIIGSYQRENMKGEVLLKREYGQNDYNDVWLNLMKSDLGITSSNLFKSDLFENGIRWNESLRSSQEYELMFQILKTKARLAIHPKIQTVIRVRESGSISQQNLDQKWERAVQLRMEIMDYLSETNPDLMSDGVVQNMFSCIRMLYPYNSGNALTYFDRYIPEGFVPQVTSVTGKSYIILYKILGFKNAEKVRGLITRKKAG